MMTMDARIEAMFNEAGAIARELNDVNEGRCDLLVWFCALRMARKILLAKMCERSPMAGALLTERVLGFEAMIETMEIVLVDVESNEPTFDVVSVYRTATEAKDRS